MAGFFIDLSDIIAKDIDAAEQQGPQGFMRASRVQTALDVVADGILSPTEAQTVYNIAFTDEELELPNNSTKRQPVDEKAMPDVRTGCYEDDPLRSSGWSSQLT
jgi:hypothetical protein